MVKEVVVDERGGARGVTYFDASDRLQTQPADIVVLAGGAIESARLLLNSRSRLFPQGLGNRHDWVGRNLQGHLYTGAVGLFAEDVFDDLGPGASIAVCDFNHGNAGLRGGGMLANEFTRLPIHFVDRRPPGLPRWGREHKEFMRRYYRRNLMVFGPTQEMPRFENRVELDPDVRDHWGIPVARLSGAGHPHTLEIGLHQAQKAERWIQEAGALSTWRLEGWSGLTAGQHQAGTCRMGSDPQTSVVDRDCRLHDLPNVFVADGGVHVTNGGFNPVLTILALAYRVGAHVTTAWKGRGLRP